jgi:hypothetical protein
MVKQKVFVFGMIMLLACACVKKESTSTSVEQAPKIKPTSANPEITKLEARKQRWQNASKCLRAMDAATGKVDVLCKETPDIKALADGVGVTYASKVVELQQKELEKQESQLKDGIIDKLPNGSPMTSGISLEIITEAYDTKRKLIDLNTQKQILCVKEVEAGISKQNVQQCQSLAEAEFKKRVADLKEDEMSNAIKKFEKNFKADL